MLCPICVNLRPLDAGKCVVRPYIVPSGKIAGNEKAVAKWLENGEDEITRGLIAKQNGVSFVWLA